MAMAKHFTNENNPHKWVKPGFSVPPSTNAHHGSKATRQNGRNIRNLNELAYHRGAPPRHLSNSNYHNKNRIPPNGSRNFVQKISHTSYNQKYNYNKSRQNRQTHDASHNSWFKVTILYGAQLEKSFVINSIKSLCDRTPFLVYRYSTDHSASQFYVKGRNEASAIQECSHKISTPENFKMKIVVNPVVEPPSSPLDKDNAEKIFEAVSSRYDPTSKSLNLEDFCKDPVFMVDEVYVSLNRPSSIDTITTTIQKLNLDIENLILANNTLQNLASFKSLKNYIPNLKRLHLGENELTKIDDLQHFSSYEESLTELFIDDNPLMEMVKDDDELIRSY